MVFLFFNIIAIKSVQKYYSNVIKKDRNQYYSINAKKLAVS